VARPTPPTEIVFGGGGGGGINGNIQTDVTMISDPNGDPTFRDRIYLRMFVNDPNEGSRDGDGIDFVEFRITEEFGDFREVHFRRENTAGYCSFGGGEPNCNVLPIRAGATWPETGIPIENGEYFAEMFVYPDNGGSQRWSVNFFIDNPALSAGDGGGDGGNDGGDQRGDLVANIAQIGERSTATTVYGQLVFQVEAFDTGRGDRDGDGIAEINHEIFGPGGDKVYGRTERNAAYCAFAGGEPDCNVFEYTIGASTWPDTDNVVESGQHLLRATVYAEDGRTTTVETSIQLQ
jgi:hypothetical protein